jgi:hypothetical protein
MNKGKRRRTIAVENEQRRKKKTFVKNELRGSTRSRTKE